MYQVFFDDFPLYDPRDESLMIYDPDPRLKVGDAGSFSFSIEPDHPYADRLTKMKGVLELRADGVPIYKGRIRKDTRDFYLSREIETEGLMACLNDSLIPPHDFPKDWEEDPEYLAAAESGNVIAFYLGWILAQHNSQVGPSQQILLGSVTVADPNNYIHRASSDYLTAMEAVRQKLENLLGGYLLADYSGDTTVLHYYSELPLTNTQVVEYGENLMDLVSILDASDVYTAILPIGSEGLTLSDLPDGEISPGYIKDGLIIYSTSAEELYGSRIIKKENWDDVTVDTNLRRKALVQLQQDSSTIAHTITVKAVDLGSTQAGAGDCCVAGRAVAGQAVVDVSAAEGFSRFVVGRHVQLQSTPHGFSATYPLMELAPDIFDPGNTEITLGGTVKASSDISHSNQIAQKENQEQLRLDIKQQQTAATEYTREQVTAAIQTAEAMIFSALESYAQTSDLDALKETVESQFSIMADEVAIRFTETRESIQNVDGDLQRTVETLAKHFEFGMDGLVIKAGESAMTLTLDNDVIVFKKNGQQFGWWDGVDFHTGNIVIDVTERAQFGNFAFVPRSNGSLSFLKVGG